jgi:hypothetical protein
MTEQKGKTDEELSAHLTEVIRGIPGVTGVFHATSLVETAADVIAAGLSLRSPDALVDIERAEGFATIRAHIATSVDDTAAEVVRRVGETVKSEVEATGSVATPMAVNIKVRVIEDR